MKKNFTRSSPVVILLLVAGGLTACAPGLSLEKMRLSRAKDAQGVAPVSVATLTTETLCPAIEIKDGTGTYRLYEKGGDGDATAVRYQANISQAARQCSDLGEEFSIKIGIAGHLLAGPKGGAGKLELPIRIAVLDAGSEDVVMSQLVKATATLEPPETQAVFTQVETITIPRPQAAGDKAIYIGFDPS
jgi:hypothetical protein